MVGSYTAWWPGGALHLILAPPGLPHPLQAPASSGVCMGPCLPQGAALRRGLHGTLRRGRQERGKREKGLSVLCLGWEQSALFPLEKLQELNLLLTNSLSKHPLPALTLFTLPRPCKVLGGGSLEEEKQWQIGGNSMLGNHPQRVTSSAFLPLTLTVTQMCGLKQERHWMLKLSQEIACCRVGTEGPPVDCIFR